MLSCDCLSYVALYDMIVYGMMFYSIIVHYSLETYIISELTTSYDFVLSCVMLYFA